MAKLAEGDSGTIGSVQKTPNSSPTPIKIIVTGGLGFVGSAIVRSLQEFHPEWDVWILDKGENRRHRNSHDGDDELDLLRGCEYGYVQADITDKTSVMDALAMINADAIIHTAGIVPSLSERYARRLEALVKAVNVEGTRHMVDAARKSRCRAFVYTSSCCTVIDDMSQSYANIDERWPVSPKSSIYGESKVEAEQIVIAANDKSMSTCVLRPSVLFGEGDNQLIPPIHACIAKGETRWVIGDGKNLWDTTYVGNVADAHVLAVENLLDFQSAEPKRGCHGRARAESAAGETFFIQNNEPISFREFSLAVWKEFGHLPPAWEIHIPEGLGWVLGLVAEVFTRVSGTPTTLSRGSVMDACAMRYASGDKARRILGYQPRVGLEAGIRASCEHYAKRLTRERR
ncbi:uncharacterized protein A1O5_00563 [Cladophialophora psammophila CBS 110553]|uniref:3-beta hydroxysteroid dehydrogenase/isomerase domain-containing protein n=1 Tax=Cladophialophora psammophila CBS 110553 TaxID=1182543 RepID=W9XFD2_9EURO|nr:uncharacterized protein A1O5_00563 [Cladophialophora psammophila CBS 110553]EXJ76055.1 hypothetical protein A1O5_00563 [Cladophialophora psammophila CBS 110553]